MTLSVIPAAMAAQLDPLIAAQHMVPYNLWEHWARRPDLPAGARIEIMDRTGAVRPWEFADLADWHEAVAYRNVEGEQLECLVCEDWTMSIEDQELFGCCEDCWLEGNRT